MEKVLSLKPCQWSILGGALLAALQAAARLKGWESPVDFLEAPSFFLVMMGFILASRSMRAKFEALGRSKAAASHDAIYMQERRKFQLWMTVASASLCSLLAVRLNFSPLFALPVLIGFPALLPAINRATGWSES